MKKIIVIVSVLVLALGVFSYSLIAEQPIRVYTGIVTSSVSGAAPTDGEAFNWYCSEETGTDKDPKLSVTYTLPGGYAYIL